MPAVGTTDFRRCLSDAFLASLIDGPLRPLRDFVIEHRLDLQIREDYINVYDGRNSLLKLTSLGARGFKAEVHEKYGSPEGLTNVSLAEAADWSKAFVEVLPGIRERASDFDSDEGRDEFSIAVANRSPPALVLDRQLQLHGVRDSKVDLAAAWVDGSRITALGLIELKRRKADHQAVMAAVGQVTRYAALYAPEGRLREDVAASLVEVWRQKSRLGLLTEPPTSVDLRSVPVKCVVAMLLPEDNAFETLSMVPQPVEVSFMRIPPEAPRLPDPSRWSVIAPRAESPLE